MTPNEKKAVREEIRKIVAIPILRELKATNSFSAMPTGHVIDEITDKIIPFIRQAEKRGYEKGYKEGVKVNDNSVDLKKLDNCVFDDCKFTPPSVRGRND